MMQPSLALQEQGEAFYFIADYHSMTSLFDPAERRQNSLDVALDFLACGLDPKRTVFFRQSDVPEVTELAWLLSTVTPMGLLERCHSYKDKTARGIAPDHGLFAYPVLMAADILIVDADLVPVGKDQKQHLEMTRDIAIKFNLLYGETFVVPEPRIEEATAVVPGLDGQKMSKSYNNTIEIFAEGKELKERVMAIVTDSAAVDAPKDPDANNVFNLLKLFITKEEQEEWRNKFTGGGLKYSDVKKRLVQRIDETFGTAREKRKELAAHPEKVEEILAFGVEKARKVAAKTLERARNACGVGK
jgi:tryptophanyl-tRNA synthetase